MHAEQLIRRLVPILYEDDSLLAVNKPAGVDVGGRHDQRAIGLIETLSDLSGGGQKLCPINRLSRYESGVLLIGKDPAIVERLHNDLRSGSVHQEYLAVVLGRMRRPRLDIDPAAGGAHPATPGKDGRRRQTEKRSMSTPSTRARGSRSPSRAISSDGFPATREPRRHHAQTSVEALKQGKGRTYVRCRTRAVNTHILRAQLRGARLRVLGDSLHDESPRHKSADLTCLHLAKMTFYHPQRRSKISVASKPPAAFPAAIDGKRDVERPLLAGLVRRLPCIAEPGVDSCRLLTGDAESVKGLVVEKYAQVIVLQVRAAPPGLTQSLHDIAHWYKDTLGVQAVYARQIVKDRPGIDDKALDPPHSHRPLAGKPAPEEIRILERGLKYTIRPREAFSMGLFLDQRDNRSRVRKMAADKDVLNLFAYTCGFSVAAAAGRAASTVSVDLSPKSLQWGRANFVLNDLDLANHQFIRSDAAEYVKRAGRQGRQFDLIIIDAPTFAHARRGKRSFSIVADLPALVAGATKLLRAGGEMMISTNNRRLSMRRFKEIVREGAAARHFRIMSTPPLPVDFAVDREHAKTIFARFE